ncbi:MAG: LptF/LptG family permease [Ignavibacteriae bacterium]|nr:LptF/LptG family permease [Ignavibacteriota bacterium]
MILAGYILRFHIAPFFFGTVTAMFIFLMQFLMLSLDKLIGKGLEQGVILQFVMYSQIPMLVLAVPMGILFSTLMAFGSMSDAQETTIIKASGGGLSRMILPSLLFGIIVFYAMFYYSDNIVPDSNHRFKDLLEDIKRKRPTFSIEAGQFSTQLGGYTILSRHVDSVTRYLKGVTIYDNRQQIQKNVVSAETGTISFSQDFSKLIVILYNGEIHQFNSLNQNDFRKITFVKHQITINTEDFDFTRSDEKKLSRGDREMRISDMKAVVRVADSNSRSLDSLFAKEIKTHLNYVAASDNEDNDLSKESIFTQIENRISLFRAAIESQSYQRGKYDKQTLKYEVEIDKKYAIPFACIVFILIGCPLGIMTKRGNFGISALLSLGFYTLYWGCLKVGEILADRGNVSPSMGMWSGNIIIGLAGLIMIYRLNNESYGIFHYFRQKISSKK